MMTDPIALVMFSITTATKENYVTRSLLIIKLATWFFKVLCFLAHRDVARLDPSFNVLAKLETCDPNFKFERFEIETISCEWVRKGDVSRTT
jgi:hypothetical protein